MINSNSKSTYSFLKSAFITDNCLVATSEIKKWLKQQNEQVTVNVNKIDFADLKHWSLAKDSIRHSSGKFFSIDGINIKTNWGAVPEWDQPIINQPEIGYLGIICKEFDGVLHFLMQAKIEPGNVNFVQLSPTLQATRSNYTQVHQGKKPMYLEYFQNATDKQILLDQLQSEQGGRFLKKRNRNIMIKIDEDIEVYDNFIWLTLGQLKELIQQNNLVNMDTRTVISGIPFGSFNSEVADFFNFLGHTKNTDYIQQAFLKSALSENVSLNSLENIINFLTRLKSQFDLDVVRKPLANLENWIVDKKEIYHSANKFFKVIAVDVEIGNREVVRWSQPMVEPAQEGLCAFVCKEIKGVLHFAVQAKLECGNFDVLEFAPTVQCLTGNYKQTKAGALPFLDYVLHAKKEQIVFDALQSEEGGRFYREQNRNLIVLAGDEMSIELPSNYIWMTLNQLYTFLKFNNFLNIQARSLISAISFV